MKWLLTRSGYTSEADQLLDKIRRQGLNRTVEGDRQRIYHHDLRIKRDKKS